MSLLASIDELLAQLPMETHERLAALEAMLREWEPSFRLGVAERERRQRGGKAGAAARWGAETRAEILEYDRLLEDRGYPVRGRAALIKRRFSVQISVRQINVILRSARVTLQLPDSD